MTNTISPNDRLMMKANSAAIWWSKSPIWSGIANDLGKAARGNENLKLFPVARELARLRDLATAQLAD